MRRAIALAKRGIGAVNPNPLVGAVIVKEGRIIGEGYHAHYGDLHAERNALASLGTGEIRVRGLMPMLDNINRILDRVALYLA